MTTDDSAPACASSIEAEIYAELRRLAEAALRHERPDHTLQPTALAHEAYLRLHAQGRVEPAGGDQFFALASVMIRRILVDHARRRHAVKRGGGGCRVALDAEPIAGRAAPMDLIAFDDALTRLAAIDARKARIVQMRFFGGLTVDQIASLIGISVRSVAQDWSLARAWLRRELADVEPQT